MDKVIVTGGAGFIGSTLVKKLVERGYYVVILDDLFTGKVENLAGLLSTKRAQFVQGSVTDLALLQRLCCDTKYIFHHAAIPSVPRSVKNPLASHETNVTGTLNVLIAARDNSVKKMVYASSSSVYGNTLTLPKREGMIPEPKSPYAVSKLAGEYYCRVFDEVYGLHSICLRYFNVYGPQQDPNSQYAAVIPRFIKITSEGEPPVIFGDGEQTRDFTFIADVVEASLLLAEGDATGTFNVARGENTTINELARLVIGIMSGSLEPVHQEPRPGDIRHSLADISKAKAFGYEPRYSLKKGLKETIAWFLQQRTGRS